MKYFITFYIYVSFCLNAQIFDNFSSQKLNTWQGDTSLFTVSNSILQSNGPSVTNQAFYISHTNNLINATEWNLSIDLKFNPTSSNFTRIYLGADNPNLKSALNGYFIQFGETNADTLDFYRQTGTSITKIFTGRRAFTFNIKCDLKIERDDSGNWKFYLDNLLEGTCNDNTITQTNYFGILCQYATASRFNQFNFDNIDIKSITKDTISPILRELKLISDTSISLKFNECIRPKNHWKNSIESSNLIFEQIDSSKSDHGELIIFTQKIDSNFYYQLKISTINDCEGNPFQTKDTLIYQSKMPKMGDIVLNEIMFNAKTNESEYVEIYNQTTNAINLKNLYVSKLKNNVFYNTKQFVETDLFIQPKSYVVICEDKNALLAKYPNSIATQLIELSSWLTLTDDSGTIFIHTENGRVIDQLHYDDHLHNPLIKNSDGVALEKIEETKPSNESQWWQSAAETSNFGTPTLKNSQHLADQNSNVLLSNKVISPNNDGLDDYCVIFLKNVQIGSYVNIKVIDSEGRVIKTLAQNSSVSSLTEIIWDGTQDNNTKAPIGAYIIWIEKYSIGKNPSYERIPVAVFE